MTISTEYELYRNMELSIHKLLTELVPSQVRVVDEDQESNLDVPTVGFYNNGYIPNPFELGDNLQQDIYYWTILVFTKTKYERDSLTIDLYHKLKEYRIPIYNLLAGDSENVIGYLYLRQLKAAPVYAPKEETTDKLKYSSLLELETYYHPE